jgi:hypothetical protein
MRQIRGLHRAVKAPTAVLAALAAALLAIAVLACAAYRHQHAGGGGGRARAQEPDLPPKARPSPEFRGLRDAAQLARVAGEVEEVKRNLATEGRYACCIRPWCSECLLRRGECHCRLDLKERGPCCGECAQGWREGRGAIQGLDVRELLKRKGEAAREHGEGCGHAPPR